MASHDDARTPNGGPQTGSAVSDEQSPENLDKVRDILFGGQMRTVEARLRSLDERMRDEQAALRAEFGRQLAELGAATGNELRALQERLQAEAARRAEELRALGSELRDALRSLESRHARLEEVTSTADADLRDQVLHQAHFAASELAKVAERLGAELAQSHQQLRADKADLATLSGLFADVAARLGEQGRRGGDGFRD